MFFVAKKMSLEGKGKMALVEQRCLIMCEVSSTRLRLSWRGINHDEEKRNGKPSLNGFQVLRDVMINRQISGTHRYSRVMLLSCVTLLFSFPTLVKPLNVG